MLAVLKHIAVAFIRTSHYTACFYCFVFVDVVVAMCVSMHVVFLPHQTLLFVAYAYACWQAVEVERRRGRHGEGLRQDELHHGQGGRPGRVYTSEQLNT